MYKAISRLEDLVKLEWLKDNKNNMAWWLKSAGALNFVLKEEQCFALKFQK